MAQIPKPATSQTVEAIYSYWQNSQNEPRRGYLGGSVIGRECERQLWYGFRWSESAGQFEGRILRLFDRGHREEATFVRELRGIGCEVYDIDPSTGQQFRFKAVYGHAGGGMDGVLKGVPEAPKSWHVAEFKTHGSKSFASLIKDGVLKSKPEHYGQVQLYMRWAKLDRALYLAVNKDTDELYSERIRYDEAEASRLEQKAERVIFAPEPLPRISEDPAFYKCKFCPASRTCHTSALPAVSCRTCLHATPEKDGDGRWSCAKWRDEADQPSTIPIEHQRTGCDSHLYIPALLARWGEVVDASEQDGWVEYRAPDGFVFRNGPWGETSYTSSELSQATPELLRNAEFAALRVRYAGRISEPMKDAA